MKITNYKWGALFFLLLVIGAACDNFEEMNQDPNKPIDVPTSALLTQAQANLVYNLNGEIAQLGAQYVQYFAQLDYTEKSNYADDGISSFNGIYTGGLTDLTEIIRLNESEKTRATVLKSGDNENQIAVAKILMAWAYQNITDVWGDIPYSEAIKDEILRPEYDTQEAIYDGLIGDLNSAQSMIKTSPSIALQGDLIFDGDIEMWDAFAESLKIRIALRLTEVNDTKAKSLIAGVDFVKAFSTATDYAHFNHLATEDEANPLYIDNVVNIGADYFACANTFIDVLNEWDDPRVVAFANAAENSGLYVGQPYGISGQGSDVDVSLPGDKYAAQTAPSILMTAAEILFAKAEAIQRGYISGDAASAYNEAIRVSFLYNGIDEDELAAYLAQDGVKYNAANWKELIGTQKWICLFAQGIQGWAEWRRLDYPVLSPGPAAVISSIPCRRAYTSTEYATNGENVAEAVARLASGKDLFTEKMWWDK